MVKLFWQKNPRKNRTHISRHFSRSPVQCWRCRVVRRRRENQSRKYLTVRHKCLLYCCQSLEQLPAS